MTTQRRLKQRIRERMQKTGESYTAARRNALANGGTSGSVPPRAALTPEDVLAHANNMRLTGRWWESRWWRKPGALYDECHVDEFETCVDVLRAVFDDGWLLATSWDHPFKLELSNVGYGGIREMLEMGRCVRAILAAGDHASAVRVIDRLKAPSEYQGARREGLVAALLQANGFAYSFLPGPGPDLQTIVPEPTFTVEVTGFYARDHDEQLSRFMTMVSRILMQEIPDTGFDVLLDGTRVDELVASEDMMQVGRAVLDELRTAAAAFRGTSRKEFVVPELLHARATEKPGQGSITGPPIDVEGWTSKAVGVIEGKFSQLPIDRPGVVAVEFPAFRVDPLAVASRLHKRLPQWRPTSRHIAGIVMITSWHTSERQRDEFIPIDNPAAVIPLSRLGWRSR